MLFDDSREEILQNIYKYAQNGCKPYCTKFDYILNLKILSLLIEKNWNISTQCLEKIV